MAFFDYPEPDDPASAAPAFLGTASDHEWEALRSHSEHLHVPAGHLVIPEGTTDRALYFVVHGALQVTTPRSKRGGERQVGVLEVGAVFGEVGFFDGKPRSANVRALTDAGLLRLSFASFEALAAKEPALGRLVLLDLGCVLATRLREVEAVHASARA